MADNTFKVFGFEIKRTKKEEPMQSASVVPPTDDDGAGYVTAPSNYYGTYVDIDGGTHAKDNAQLIQKYRNLSIQPEVDMAIEEIVNEAIVTITNGTSVELNLDSLEVSDSIKNKMFEEFKNITNMLNFNELGHDIFRSWYIDGRIYHHLIIDEKNPKQGIKEIRYIDATKIRKVKDIKYSKDESTGIKVVQKVEEFYLFQDKVGNSVNYSNANNGAVKLSNDSVSYVTSGLLDEERKRVVSYLHKAIKVINQLRMMEDSLVIYRLSRAPERRIFYIDVGNLPRGKAEEYMNSIMSRYRNKLVYDASTGQLKDDRKHMSMLEDFWLPRREGGRGTEITTLPGGQNLGEIEDIIYFQKKVYRALNVPVSRLEQEAQYSLGRATEISREEVKFQKFVNKLRNRFSKLFIEILKKQLILKGVITESDWNIFKHDINVDYLKDNYFAELKDIEMTRERLNIVDQANQYVGEYISKEWVLKNVLMFTDEQISDIKQQINSEKSSGEISDFSIAQQNQPMIQQQMQADQEQPEAQPTESFYPTIEERQALVNIELMETVKDYLNSGN